MLSIWKEWKYIEAWRHRSGPLSVWQGDGLQGWAGPGRSSPKQCTPPLRIADLHCRPSLRRLWFAMRRHVGALAEGFRDQLGSLRVAIFRRHSSRFVRFIYVRQRAESGRLSPVLVYRSGLLRRVQDGLRGPGRTATSTPLSAEGRANSCNFKTLIHGGPQRATENCNFYTFIHGGPQRGAENCNFYSFIHEGPRRAAKNCNFYSFIHGGPRRTAASTPLSAEGREELQLQTPLSAKGREETLRTATSTPLSVEGIGQDGAGAGNVI